MLFSRLRSLRLFKTAAEELYPDVFAAICSVLVKNVYEQKEHIFVAGAWSTHLYVTAAGHFEYTDEFHSQELDADQHWFGELSLPLGLKTVKRGWKSMENKP